MSTATMIVLLERHKLEHLQKRFGHFTRDEALQLAIEAEQFCKDCGPFDPAYSHFKQQQLALEEYALLLERRGE